MPALSAAVASLTVRSWVRSSIRSAGCAALVLALLPGVASGASTEALSGRVADVVAGPILAGEGVAWAEMARDNRVRLRFSRPGAGRARPRTLLTLKNPNWERRQVWISAVAGSRSRLAFLVEVKKHVERPPAPRQPVAAFSRGGLAGSPSSNSPYRLVAQRLLVGPPEGRSVASPDPRAGKIAAAAGLGTDGSGRLTSRALPSRIPRSSSAARRTSLAGSSGWSSSVPGEPAVRSRGTGTALGARVASRPQAAGSPGPPACAAATRSRPIPAPARGSRRSRCRPCSIRLTSRPMGSSPSLITTAACSRSTRGGGNAPVTCTQSRRRRTCGSRPTESCSQRPGSLPHRARRSFCPTYAESGLASAAAHTTPIRIGTGARRRGTTVASSTGTRSIDSVSSTDYPEVACT